jgi:hypothetical protein
MIDSKFDLFCITSTLPTIKDGNTWWEVANDRKSITVTQCQRVEFTLKFNYIIAEFCKLNNIKHHYDKNA